ncbi:MAG TPA: hypothetical protein VFH54_01500 [Mycobacteriales bacterium]|nr:hypothetical protein [Mycobacteriales bacterium]
MLVEGEVAERSVGQPAQVSGEVNEDTGAGRVQDHREEHPGAIGIIDSQRHHQ